LNPVWRRGLLALAGVAAAVAVVRAALGPDAALLVAFFSFGGLALGHLRQMSRLLHWALGEIEARVPDADGTWGVIFAGLHRRVRRRVEQQRDLTLSLERFRTAAEAVPDGMVILDAHGCIVWSNARAQLHLGIDPARDRGQPIVNLVRQPEFVGYVERMAFGEPVVFASSRDAGVVLSVQVVPYGTDQRLLVSRDVTRLEEVARMRRDFIANVSHELRTPLTVLTGFLETLEDAGNGDERSRRYVRLMQEQAQSMQRLVDDLLTLSSLEASENPVREEAVDVADLARRAKREAEVLSGGQHRIELDLDTNAALRGSRDELASALGNLVNNAVRYTPPGGVVRIGWSVREGEGWLAVADSGIGIAPEHIPRLTERFYRVDRSRSRATGGTGLGLAIVKHVLLRHDGELGIESEPGKGSVFTARFPAARLLPAGSAGASSRQASRAVPA
jgi:two-component system phosphate regulon sensor histidine kinase PhoR